MRAFETTIMQKKWESEFDELLKELEQFRKDFAQTKKCTCHVKPMPQTNKNTFSFKAGQNNNNDGKNL